MIGLKKRFLALGLVAFLLLGISVISSSSEKVKYKKIHLHKLADIKEVTEKNKVPRVVYDMGSLKLTGLTVPTKKKAFIAIMVPTAMVVREEIELKRKHIKKMIDGKIKKDEKMLAELYKLYRIKDKKMTTLYKNMKPAPISILLAQASIESAWGTSRFFREANNIFGVWSFRKDEPRISTPAMRGKKHIFLRKYGTLKEAIEDYMLNLARHHAYARFRHELQRTSNYTTLAKTLDKYSEEGHVYTKKIIASIKYNKFDKYDHYKFIK